MLRRFEPLCHWVRDELSTRDVVLDGELVALDEHGRQDFRLLMRGGGNLNYAVFDVLWLKGKDLRESDLTEAGRKALEHDRAWDDGSEPTRIRVWHCRA